MHYITSILICAVSFLLFILLLSVKPSISKRITFCSLAIASISGLLIYGYGYAYITDNVIVASMKALLAVCGTFVGKNEFGAISSVPFMKTAWMELFCMFVRICALYTTASAVVATIGREALKRLRLWLSRRGTVHIIYGSSDDALSFGRELAQKKQGIVVFVSDKASSSAAITAMGCVLKSDNHALSADERFLRSIGFHRGQRELVLYALNKNFTSNISYARKLLAALQSWGVDSRRLHLVALGHEQAAVSALQATAQSYGYGFASAVDEPRMAARLLTQKFPPADALHFDGSGAAADALDVLLVGFGSVGQEVLKSVVASGQFEGGAFHMAVFASDCERTNGRFADQLGALSDNYDISFYGCDARSKKMYEYLALRRDSINYVVICTGKEDSNREIAEDMTAYFQRYGRSLDIYVCSRRGVEAYSSDGTVSASYNIYKAELLCGERLDRMAMLLNHSYMQPTDKSPLECWMECDYFSRESCRASADFTYAMLRSVGKTADEVIRGEWTLTDEQKINLSKTEHLRWCAFHYCMGFSAMTDAEFDSRAREYLYEVARDGTSKLRISKNMAGRTHACLVGWDELKLLSEKEAAITGVYRDYQSMDTDNVMAVPSLLRASAEL